MSRKHYIAIAATFAHELEGATDPTRVALERVAGELATQLKRDNPNFNRTKFLTAAGVRT